MKNKKADIYEALSACNHLIMHLEDFIEDEFERHQTWVYLRAYENALKRLISNHEYEVE